MAKIKQNLCWAFAYNLVGIPLAAGALLPTLGVALTPSLSGALMGFSSLAVMGNSLTLQWDQGPKRPAAAAGGGKAAGTAAAPAAAGSESGDGLSQVVVVQEGA